MITARTSAQRQRGAILFIALIALVVMTMGALAMFRSVDAATGISGNIGFRQQGIAATDVAVEQAMTWLAGAADLTNNSAGNGYFATQSFGLTNDDILTLDWNTNSFLVGTQNGYELRYVIHRLCTQTGAPAQGICPDSGNTLTQTSQTQENPALTGSGSITPMYRITARAVGPRESESIVQTITY